MMDLGSFIEKVIGHIAAAAPDWREINFELAVTDGGDREVFVVLDTSEPQQYMNRITFRVVKP